MKTLNDITAEMLKVNDLIEQSIDEHGEIRPEVADALADYFNAVAQTRSQKIDAYLALIREKEMRAVAAKAQEEQWAKKRSAENRAAEWLKEKLKQHLELTGEAKIVTDTGRVVSIQKNGGKPPVVYDDEAFNAMTEDEIARLEADGFVVMQPVINKAKVRQYLEDEMMVFTFAKLGEPGTHLRIR